MANPVVHTELAADNVAAARKFYGSLFNWKFKDLGPEMGNYTMVDFGSRNAGAGITPKMMAGQPTAWLSYIEVASVKKTIAKAKKAGAKIVVPYEAIGGGMGALGVFIDPQGAALGVWEKAKPKGKAKKPARK